MVLLFTIGDTKPGSDCLQSVIPNCDPIVYNQGYQTGIRLFTISDTKPGFDCLQSGIPNQFLIVYNQGYKTRGE